MKTTTMTWAMMPLMLLAMAGCSPADKQPESSSHSEGDSVSVCGNDQLATQRVGGDAGMGSVHETYQFTNTGDAACTLPGTPGVKRLSSEHGELPPTVQVDDAGKSLSLAPGKSAYLTLELSNLSKDGSPFPAQKCQAVALSGIDVTLAPGAAPITLKHEGYGCLSGIDKLDVQPLSTKGPEASAQEE